MAKKVAIIGSGASGLAAIKCCLDEGLTPVCFERTDHIGGLWYYTDTPVEGQSCVMKTTVINTSKEIMSYSDFLIPEEFPMYMHNTKVIDYFHMYADYVGASKYTRFKAEVLDVRQTENFAETGQWELKVKDIDNDVISSEIFDAVLVCSGHHAEKKMPTFEGMSDFRGKFVHTHDYRHHVGYEGKRVVVLGIGNSGGDVIVELSRIASQVYVSTRRGSWIFNRIADDGCPGDLTGLKRINDIVRFLLPRSWMQKAIEDRLNKRFDHAKYGLKPAHSIFAQHPTVNDELPNRIACGSIIVKPNIKRFTKSGIEFEDGSFVDDVDVVILATGYKFGFPFTSHPALEVKNNEINFYKYVFPPEVKPATLAVIGCIQPLGAIMPISEMQCRWATRVFKGITRLPPRAAMERNISTKRAANRARYVDSTRHTIQVDYIDYMDDLATEFGSKPNLVKLFFTDPRLWARCLFGPFSPYQYRLSGPGRWAGARDAILTIWERTFAGLATNLHLQRAAPERRRGSPLLRLVVGAVVLGVVGQVLLKYYRGQPLWWVK